MQARCPVCLRNEVEFAGDGDSVAAAPVHGAFITEVVHRWLRVQDVAPHVLERHGPRRVHALVCRELAQVDETVSEYGLLSTVENQNGAFEGESAQRIFARSRGHGDFRKEFEDLIDGGVEESKSCAQLRCDADKIK